MTSSRAVVPVSFADLPRLRRSMQEAELVWFNEVAPLFDLLIAAESFCETAANALAEERTKIEMMRTALIKCRMLIGGLAADPFDRVESSLAEVRRVSRQGMRAA